jgi:hypothetical protein
MRKTIPACCCTDKFREQQKPLGAIIFQVPEHPFSNTAKLLQELLCSMCNTKLAQTSVCCAWHIVARAGL